MPLCSFTGLEVATHKIVDRRYPTAWLFVCPDCLEGLQKNWTQSGQVPPYFLVTPLTQPVRQ